MNFPVEIKYVFLLVCVLCLFSCKNKDKVNVTPVSANFVTYKNILYGTDTVQQVFDLTLPNTRDIDTTPIVIVLHGGAWSAGDKSDYYGFGFDTLFSTNGMAMVNMNYRLDQKYGYPAPIEDIGTVLEYIKQHAHIWQVNPNKICLLGKSAGGQLALLYGYSKNTDHRIKVIVDCCGPSFLTDSDLVYSTLGKLNISYWLGSFSTHENEWQSASPSSYLNNALPTAILYGLEDTVVNPKQSKKLQDTLNSLGVPTLNFTWAHYGHGWDLASWQSEKDITMVWMKFYLLSK